MSQHGVKAVVVGTGEVGITKERVCSAVINSVLEPGFKVVSARGRLKILDVEYCVGLVEIANM